LWIGGHGLARGYRGEPELTRDRFVEHEGERWYRTGDLGRYWPDGTLEFLGRADFQVKIRGHRIELGEIEAALERYAGVHQAVAVAYGENRSRLGAAVVGEVDRAALAANLAAQLPAYMVPEPVLVLVRMPLSGNGKIDRKQLATWLEASPRQLAANATEPPQGEIERRLAALWSELLHVSPISRLHNFFALGGDSLLATRLAEEARRRFGLELELGSIFSSLTLADMAMAAEQSEDETETETGTIA
jgi:hypothetical protein